VGELVQLVKGKRPESMTASGTAPRSTAASKLDPLTSAVKAHPATKPNKDDFNDFNLAA